MSTSSTSLTSRAEDVLPDYAELHCLSNFSFQRGVSHPAELVERAEKLGYTALAITDECSVAGVVRAHLAVRNLSEERKAKGLDAFQLKLLLGSEFRWGDLCIVAIARDLNGWGDLCEFITEARGGAVKGSYLLTAKASWH